MRKTKIFSFLAVIASAALFSFFVYSVFLLGLNDFPWFSSVTLDQLAHITYYSAALPLLLVALSVTGTVFWIGWVIITTKVAPPMTEIVGRNDHSRIKAFILCLAMVIISAALIYGVYIRSFWALALPALMISAVVLGAIFWVGVTIITTRATLPVNKKQEETA
ncbi:MAG: hypothetical protein U1E11_07625 [Dethiobacteria bacterium]|nr:hypothetical protein [Dethiobacteria bacterium]